VSRPPTGKKTSVNKRGSPMNATECDASDLLALAPRVPPTRIRPRSAPNPPPLNNKPNGLVLLVNLQAREKQKRKTENKSQKTLVAISRVGELTQNFWMSLSKNSKGSRTFSQTRDYTTFGAANRSKILGPVSCLRKQVHAPCAAPHVVDARVRGLCVTITTFGLRPANRVAYTFSPRSSLCH